MEKSNKYRDESSGKSYKCIIVIVMCIALLSMLQGCGDIVVKENTEVKLQTEEKTESGNMRIISLAVNDQVLVAELADNSSADALMKMLEDGPLSIKMSDYGNMEKVGDIGTDLPTNDKPTKTKAGDLILYMGNQFVIYYAPNSWNFTRLGKIQDVTAAELKKILGGGDVTVTLSLAE